MSSVMDGFLVLIVLSGIVFILQGQNPSSRNKMIPGCHLYTQTPVFEYEYYQRGDVMIGGLVSVHTAAGVCRMEKGTLLKKYMCIELDIPEYTYMMPFFLAIDEINKDPNILPNITLGYHLFDTCSYIFKAIDSTLRILTGGGQMGVPNYLCMEGAEVAGFVGDATFLPTLAVAELLNIYQYPQISHGTTDLLLSDREKFPNFYRTIPSNWNWYESVMELLITFGWNWVGIITSSDGTGETELRELRKEMTRHGICIEFIIYLTTNEKMNRKRVRVIEKSTTDVVILCGQFNYVYKRFSKESKVLRQNMTLIVSHSWNVVGYNEISLKETFNCSIVAAYALSYIPGLEDYLNNVHPSKRPDDPLLEDIWLHYFKCPSSNKYKNTLIHRGSASNITCTGPESLAYHFTEKNDGKFGFIYTAVYALAHALNNMKLRRNKSGNYGIRKKFPSTPQEWQTVASHFAQRWDFPNCGGAIDGKHVHIIPPPNSGSYYYNYKGFNSIVMLAVVSANYEFLYVDVGKKGRMSDGGVITQREFYRHLQNGSLDLPPPEDNVEGLPFLFIADEAFALGNHLIQPFPMRTLTPDQRIFNYRLARARRVVENTFGIMASRFCLFLTPIHMAEYKLNHIILACCVLHKFLRKHSANYAGSVGPEAGIQNEPTLTALESGHTGLPSLSARDVQLRYLEFFVGRGAINMPDNV